MVILELKQPPTAPNVFLVGEIPLRPPAIIPMPLVWCTNRGQVYTFIYNYWRDKVGYIYY